MTTAPLATIADAIIEFILSLLRDSDAAADFQADPDAALADAGLSDICAEDIRTVMPVVVDRPDVVSVSRPDITVHTPPPTIIVRPEHPKQDLIREITNIANHFTIDNRSMIVDQSINQSIWAEGDVMQYFDHEAVLALGDGSYAAGNDNNVDNSRLDLNAGDINIGNTHVGIDVADSFNDQSTHTDVDVNTKGSLNDNSSSTNTSNDVDVAKNIQVSSNTSNSNVDTDSNSAKVVVVEDSHNVSQYSAPAEPMVVDATPNAYEEATVGAYDSPEVGVALSDQ